LAGKGGSVSHVTRVASHSPSCHKRRAEGGAQLFSMLWCKVWCLGELRHISKLKPWPLYDVLTEKYEWEHSKAKVRVCFICKDKPQKGTPKRDGLFGSLKRDFSHAFVYYNATDRGLFCLAIIYSKVSIFEYIPQLEVISGFV
jgi:hypothetical protein